jgi:hypothetical protein
MPLKSGFPSAVRGALYPRVVCPHNGATLSHNAQALTTIKLVMAMPLLDSGTKTSHTVRKLRVLRL